MSLDDIEPDNNKEAKLGFVNDITDFLQTNSELEQKLQEIVHHLRNRLQADVCSIFLYDPLADTLVLEASSGMKIDADVKFEIKANEGISGWVVKNLEHVCIKDLKSWHNAEVITDIDPDRYKSLLSLPIATSKEVYGVINLQTIETTEFRDDEVKGMTVVCRHLANAIHNELLKKKLEVDSDAYSSEEDVAAADFVGESRHINRINKFVQEAARDDKPVLFTGEIGTGKGLLSRMIHVASLRNEGPYIRVDCAALQKDTRGEDLVGRDIEEYGSLAIVKRGFFEKADKGTLFLNNVEALDNVSQIKLLSFLEKGTFNRLPGNTLKKVNVRIIASTNVNIEELVAESLFDKQLYDVLRNREFETKPLRKMKRDIPELCSYFLKKLSREFHKPGLELSVAAEKKIQSYDWPGNVTELETVLERAAVIVTGTRIEEDMLFFSSQTERDNPKYNLFNYSWLAKMLKGDFFPGLISKFVLIGFWVSIFTLLFYPQNNVLNSAFWSIGWFSLFLMTFLLGRVFCSFCPFMSTAELLRKLKCFGNDRPAFAIKHGNIIATGLILLIFWLEGGLSFYNNPQLTAFLFLFITSGAVIFSLIYLRRVWCRYLCPTGNLVGIFSLTSFLSVGADKHVCMYRCKTHECYTGTDKEPGCQLFLHPYSIESPNQCVSCMQCHKNCPNDSVKLNLQFPGTGLLAIHSPSKSFAFLSTALLGILPVEYFLLLLSEYGIQASGGNGLPFYSLIFLLSAFIPILLLLFIEKVLGSISLQDAISRLTLSAYSLIPMALYGFLGLYGMKSVLWFESIMTNYGGLQVDFFSANFVFKTVAVIGIIVGMIGSIHSYYRLYRSDTEFFALNKKMFAGYLIFLTVYLTNYIAAVIHL